MKKILIFIVIVFPLAAFSQRTFVHPGLSHKQSDLERMRYMVEAGKDPWKTSFDNLKNDSKSSYNYVVQGNETMTTITQDGENYGAFSSDVLAAYLNALMWGITQDERHAQKCVEIFNSWCNVICFTGGGTESLNAGRVIWKLLEAAEIIKSTYSGWAEGDIQRFKEMLVYPGLSHEAKPVTVDNQNGTFYWRMYNGDPGRHGNQDLFGWRGILAMGVFLDDEIIYDRALRYLKGLPHRADDIPYASGPPENSASPVSTNQYFDAYAYNGTSDEVVDYGYNGVLEHYIWENGQCQESSRDQDHAILGVGMYASLAEIAWNQGDDLYGFLDYRILLGYEYALRYNVSYAYSFSDQTDPWEPTSENGSFLQRRDRTGRWFSKSVNPHYESDFDRVSRGNFHSNKRPIYEVAYAHYNVRQGLPESKMKWLMRSREISLQEYGQEKNGWSLDHLGWGGLTCYRVAGMAGDPCSFEDGEVVFGVHELPGTIEAEDFDYFSSVGEGRTYHDKSATNLGGSYSNDADVDIEETSAGDYVLTEIEDGEWLTYTIAVKDPMSFGVKINYSASSAGSRIKLEVDGIDHTGEVDLPFGVNGSTGINDWQNLYIEPNIELAEGVHVLRIHFSGTSDVSKINSFTFLPGKIDDNFNSTSDGWQAATSGTFVEIIEGALKMNLASLSNGSKRGDMIRSQGASLHPGYYPIVAIKMEAPEISNIILDTELGAFGNGANKWTGKTGDVYYYDLTSGGFGSSSTMLPADEYSYLSRFQFKVADITSGEEAYYCDWVKTFESLEALQAYMEGNVATMLNEGRVGQAICYFKNGYLVFRGIEPLSVVSVFDLSGRKIDQQVMDKNQNRIQLQRPGAFIVCVDEKMTFSSTKVISQ